MLEKIFVHAGTPKTGTSTLQRMLAENRDLLLESRILYPRVPEGEGYQHSFLYSWAHDEPMALRYHRLRGRLDIESINEYHQRCLECFERDVLRSHSRTLIVSNGTLSRLNPENLGQIRKYFENYCSNIKIVLYIRHPLSLFISGAQQGLRGGHYRLDRLKENLDVIQFDSVRSIDSHVEAFGRENVIVRPFERSQFLDGNVARDFLDIVGISRDNMDSFKCSVENPSVTWEALQLLDSIEDTYPVLDPQTNRKNYARSDNYSRAIVKRVIRGKKFSLDSNTLQLLMQKID